MKKLIQKISFSSLMLFAMTIGNAHAVAAPDTISKGTAYATTISSNICQLVKDMGALFSTLRTLAFVGAAFIIAGWAWGYISKPGDLKLEDVKNKGIGMLVGFFLLFCVGAVISVFLASNGPCADAFKNW